VHKLINVALIGVIGLCTVETFHRNLYECALFLGRTLFAFLLAMALFEPLTPRFRATFDVAIPYANAAVFFFIWVVVLWGFEPFALEILKDTGRKMTFKYERLGQLLVGLTSGLLVSGALSANLVMLPPVEGLYFQNRSQPIGGMHRTVEGAYRILTLSSTHAVTLAQMEAGAHWARERANKLMREGNPQAAKQLVQTFDERYCRDTEPTHVRRYREQLLAELRQIVKEK
jgi:hypothetical protein